MNGKRIRASIIMDCEAWERWGEVSQRFGLKKGDMAKMAIDLLIPHVQAALQLRLNALEPRTKSLDRVVGDAMLSEALRETAREELQELEEERGRIQNMLATQIRGKQDE